MGTMLQRYNFSKKILEENVSRFSTFAKGKQRFIVAHTQPQAIKTFMPLILKLELILLKPIPSQEPPSDG
jgi:hypothetical protein